MPAKRKCPKWPACPSADECGMAHPGRNDDPLKWPALRDGTHAHSLPEKKVWIAQSAAKPQPQLQDHAQSLNAELEASERRVLQTADKSVSVRLQGDLLSWDLPKKAIGPGENRSRNVVCQYYPYCIRGRSCFYLHPHEAQNGRNIDSAAAGGIGMIRKIRERQSIVHARILAGHKDKKQHAWQQKLSKKARRPRISTTTPSANTPLAAEAACTIPFETSVGFRTAFLSIGGTPLSEPMLADMADSSLSHNLKHFELAGAPSQTEARQASKDIEHASEEWYGEEISLEEESSA